MNCQVVFEPSGKKTSVLLGSSLLEAARKAGIQLESPCAGKGQCGKCLVQIKNGNPGRPGEQEKKTLDQEKLEGHFRLACSTVVKDNLVVSIPFSSLQHIQKLSILAKEKKVPVNPSVQKIALQLKDCSRQEKKSVERYLLDCLSMARSITAPCFDFGILSYMEQIQVSPEQQKDDAFVTLTIYKDREVCGLEAGDTSCKCLGAAIDLGTTKIACYLVDLITGKEIAALGTMNPQILLGEDIVTRLTASLHEPGAAAKLQELVISCINELLDNLCQGAGYTTGDLYEVVIVGNSAIHHLLLGLPVKSLALFPFIPLTSRSLAIKARELGIKIAPSGYLYLPPLVASYIGSDHAAALLALNFSPQAQGTLWVDIGTNTEITLAYGGKAFCCSCASGPAMEGMQIKHGMRAAAGAIEKVTMEQGYIHCSTIDRVAPLGLCGSGIIDLVAELQRHSLINERGILQRGASGVRKAPGQKYLEVVVVPKGQSGIHEDIVVTQKDIEAIQLSKSAIATGIELLCRQAGLKPKGIQKIYLAGNFGSFIHLASAVKIGLLPDLPENKYIKVGNAAGEGAKVLVKSEKHKRKIEKMVNELKYIELVQDKSFSGIFAKNIMFP